MRTAWKVAPQLDDYESVYASFAWDAARRELSGLPGGGLNMAQEAVDRHAAGPLAEHAGLRRGQELWALGLYDDARSEFEALEACLSVSSTRTQKRLST